MDSKEFTEAQTALGLNNAELAVCLDRSEQAVSNYRTGRQSVPPVVERLMKAWLRLAEYRPVTFRVEDLIS